MKRFISITAFIFLFLSTFAQSFDMSDNARKERMKKDVHLLASDSLLGREAGTKGEIMAMHYLADQFKKINLKPVLKDNTYFQRFEFIRGATYEDETEFRAGDEFLQAGKEFYPLSQSASADATAELINMGFGLETDDMQDNDYAGKENIKDKAFLIELSVPGGAKNFAKYAEQAKIKHKIKTAEKHGAAAVVFVNSDPELRAPSDKLSMRVVPADIPVVFVKKSAAAKVKEQIGKQVKLSVKIRKIRKDAYNLIGMIDNNAGRTIVYGAHYDHLGMGGPSSRYLGPPKVHNGADDNASGVAGILEIARKLRTRGHQKFNYLIIAFSAEEHGLIGSSYFTGSKAYDMDKIVAMINFDMIGRMEENKLHIAGTGTAKEWDDLIESSNELDLQIKTSASGTGGSDQMSFYLDSIPVLFYFTGLHDDYHKPADDADKISFGGMLKVLKTVENLYNLIPENKGLTYQKTESKRSGRNPAKYSVTLGVMPDHAFDGDGMRIENVIQGRTASEAGLKDGDIVVKMGEHEVDGMMSYMKALSKFKKGNKTTVKIRRGNKILEKKVQFK